TVWGMSVPQLNRSVVVTSPFRLTERRSASPGVDATACSIGSATSREASVAAAPGYTVRIVRTGSVMSGRSETGRRESETAPSSQTADGAALGGARRIGGAGAPG